ncbi:MAG TPA: CRISPR-associated endoribonuclease Cas6 [Dysgonamonadaceae bacterium]|jgi:CRISPR-associated endoribonuclease Cas6|nr:CRISPR-associated endoribonuclease Cas6 [Dysgonamonadaceae bacterium]
MEFTVNISIDRKELPFDYRRNIISLIKKGLTEFCEGAFFNLYYGGTKQKPFCFAARFHDPVFENERIVLETSNFELIVSAEDEKTFLILFQSFVDIINKPLPIPEKNSLIVKSINKRQRANIKKENVAAFDLLSPLCIRLHNRETNRDEYISVKDSRFTDEFKINLKNQLKNNYAHLVDEVDSLLIDTSYCKKTVVFHYGQWIECTIGKIFLQGSPELLQTINLIKLGSRKSAGFGFIKLIHAWETKNDN